MKFMELDEAGFIHHIMDDPCITMIPVVNRFSSNQFDTDGNPVSHHGHRMLGTNPTDHLVHLLPKAISNAHWDLIMSSGGVGGDKWQWKWDSDKQEPVKVSLKDTLPERKFSNNIAAAGSKPCGECPDKDKANA